MARPTLAQAVALALLLTTSVAGCGDDDDGAGATTPLPSSPWTLAAGIDVTGWEDAAPSATFADGKVTGSTGCNRYTAPVTVDGTALTIGQVAATQKACKGPAAAVETEYLAALERVRSWSLDGDELVLRDDSGAELLRFSSQTLTGAWTATMILNGDAVTTLIAGTEITATFSDDRQLSGSAGCNTYMTTYDATGGALKIAEPATSRKLCPEPEGAMEQEQAFLAALAATTNYRIEGSTLSLLTNRGTFTATFKRN